MILHQERKEHGHKEQVSDQKKQVSLLRWRSRLRRDHMKTHQGNEDHIEPKSHLQNAKHPTDQLKWDSEQTQDGTSEDHRNPIQQEHESNKGKNTSLLSKGLHGCHQDDQGCNAVWGDDRWKGQRFERQSQGWLITRRVLLVRRKKGLQDREQGHQKPD